MNVSLGTILPTAIKQMVAVCEVTCSGTRNSGLDS